VQVNKKEIAKYSLSGNMPPHGNLEDAEAILAFPFGYRADSEGQYKEPGTTNIALADFIAANPVLSQMDIVLSEELADALDGRMKGKTTVLSNFEQGQAGTTYDYAERARRLVEIHDVGKLAVVAFRFHLPRAGASIEKVGFSTIVPDLREVGDFDPESAQWWTRSKKLWVAREAAVLPASILKKQV
jgi:hypothetical protein